MLITGQLLRRHPKVVHGFTTRAGGVSGGALSSLNLARRPGEQDEHLVENWGRVLAWLGLPEGQLSLVNQVHGAQIVSGDAPSGPLDCVAAADGLVVTRPGVVAAVRAADCVPILLSAPGGVAAVHAGWRGTAQDIVVEAVGALCSRTGSAPEQVLAVVGPAIGACCYAVGQEVVQAISRLVPADQVVLRQGDRTTVDLKRTNELRLLELGVGEVEVLHLCTRCDPRLYSHRGNGAETGRFAGVIGLLP